MRTLLLATIVLALCQTETWAAHTAGGPPVVQGKFRRKRSRINAKLGSPRHSVNDAFVRPGVDTVLRGKFSYGKISKDLEREDVEVWRRIGTAWKKLGTVRTNSDGRVRFRIRSANPIAGQGVEFLMYVVGDGTWARGRIWNLAKARVAVYDIDGTLTLGDRELVAKSLFGSAIEMRPGASAMVKHYTGTGLLPIYLTGRPYMYNADTRLWLRRNGFPVGPVITADFVGQGVPSSSGVGRFKRKVLSRLTSIPGLIIDLAFGNAGTDICAFAYAKIPPSKTFIVGKNAGLGCQGGKPTRPVHDWRVHLKSAIGTKSVFRGR